MRSFPIPKRGFTRIKPRFDRGNFGFTLIELLVVIAVVGVLAGAVIAIINPGAQLARARDAKRKADIHAIKQALEEYLVVNGSYPNTDTVTPPYDDSITTWVYSSAAAPWIPGLNSAYMKAVPKDPLNSGGGPWNGGSNYLYAYASNGVHYNLVAQLESASDPDRCELKQWFFITAANGGGGSWCGSYSIRLYATNNKNN